MNTHTSLAWLAVVTMASALAQSPGHSWRSGGATAAAQNNTAIHGQVYFGNSLVGSLTVELSTPNGVMSVSAPVQGDGTFDVTGLAPGRYDLQIVGFGGQVVHQETVMLWDGDQRVSVFVKNDSGDAGQAPGTVSVRQLQHKVPEQARAEFEKGQSAMKKRDRPKALEHFQRAENIDPEFAEAYNNSGVANVELGQLQDAAGQFQKAVDLVPDYAEALSNLSIALCRLKQYPESADMARRALRLNSSLLKMRYILGLSLTMEEGGDKTEALENIRLAAVEIPEARLLAGKILEENGEREEAAQQVDAYLRSAAADRPDRKSIEDWLAELQH
jgi:tetratricopeptide (TPR) repeat protein